MNFGIIVEGDDDAVVYRVLIKRLDNSIEHVHCRTCGGRQKLKNKFVAFLKEFDGNPAAFRIRKTLVIRDSDCNEPGPLEEELRDILDSSGFQPRIPVSFHATKCKLESWLLADESAINSVSLARGSPGGLQRIEPNLETHKDSDVLYEKVLIQVGLQNTAAVMARIAQNANLDGIAGRCPRFREFARKVVDH